MSARAGWLRSNGFVLGLGLAVALAFLAPAPGAQGGILHAEIVNHAGIALILFLQGLSLSLERVRRGAGNWRVHLIVQAFTFGVFPLVGLLFHAAAPGLGAADPPALRDGFLYLCVLPSTISTSVVLTAVAGGNTAAALFNAALSNMLGVFLTPVLVQLLLRETGQSAPIGPLLLKITALTLVPFFGGMGLRPVALPWVERHKPWVARVSNTVIVFIVYSAFCDSVQGRIWARHGVWVTLRVFLSVVVLFAGMSLLIHFACRWVRLGREDYIAAYFCSVKKTLAMGVPLALLIFGKRADLGLVLLPILFYHPLQLFVNGLFANHWARRAAAPSS